MTPPYAPLLLHGDCLVELARIPSDSIDSIVTDPPYGLSQTDPAHVAEALRHWVTDDRAWTPPVKGGFMGKSWDSFVPPPAVWDECMRILKPGGHLLTFAGSRTIGLMEMSVRLAGFDIRDSIAWLYGSGFPKSMDVSKAIDKAAGAERTEVTGSKLGRPGMAKDGSNQSFDGSAVYGAGGVLASDITAPATDAAREWEGWGTALKPAFEPIIVARKPFAGTVAANVLEHGTGALNIDASRIETTDDLNGGAYAEKGSRSESASLHAGSGMNVPGATTGKAYVAPAGRWPANVILDESQAAELDRQAPKTGAAAKASGPSRTGESTSVARGMFAGVQGESPFYSDLGGASRFFYVAKAPKSERPVVDGVAHPTVKPLALMRWLAKLVTPPGGCLVDPFAGSGTTLEAAYLEGFESIGVEMTEEYWPLIAARIERVTL